MEATIPLIEATVLWMEESTPFTEATTSFVKATTQWLDATTRFVVPTTQFVEATYKKLRLQTLFTIKALYIYLKNIHIKKTIACGYRFKLYELINLQPK